VQLERHEARADRLGDLRIWVRIGIQPIASPSGDLVDINQDRPAQAQRLLLRLDRIMEPRYRHPPSTFRHQPVTN
jgi:hypothetical protein